MIRERRWQSRGRTVDDLAVEGAWTCSSARSSVWCMPNSQIFHVFSITFDLSPLMKTELTHTPTCAKYIFRIYDFGIARIIPLTLPERRFVLCGCFSKFLRCKGRKVFTDGFFLMTKVVGKYSIHMPFNFSSSPGYKSRLNGEWSTSEVCMAL